MTEMSKEYGVALFALAKECDAADEYKEALDTVTAVFRENPEYIDFLDSPSIAKNERTNAVEAAFGGRVPEHIVSFLQLLCEKGHIHSYTGCVKEYTALYDASKKVSVARVTSAVPLTDKEKDGLRKKLEKISGNSVFLECTTDKSLMGGLAVEIDGKVIDGTLRHRLNEVKDVIGR
ncbi:MAG: ATP synthase F1 subunit delta [Eubacteriales bacterium]